MEEKQLALILEEIKQLKGYIDALNKKTPESPFRSEDIKELATALAKAQSEMPVATKSKSNPYFKSSYADLTDIIRASRPCLTKNGLSVVQDIITKESGESVLYTILFHASGQWLESRVRVVPPKNDIQSLSSHISYLKRLSYSALIGVVSADEDDDGEMAMVEARDGTHRGTAINTKYSPKEQSHDTITKEQREELEYELAEYPDIGEMVIEGLKIQSIADMPKSKFQVSINRIREIKQLRNNGK